MLWEEKREGGSWWGPRSQQTTTIREGVRDKFSAKWEEEWGVTVAGYERERHTYWGRKNYSISSEKKKKLTMNKINLEVDF